MVLAGPVRRKSRYRRVAALVVVAVAAGVGCHPTPEPTVPGQTDIAVTSVEIEPRAGEALAVDYEPLLENLGADSETTIRDRIEARRGIPLPREWVAAEAWRR